ncbi:MAG: hypothetical protein KKH98_10955 [Spirochaetes bacterium]|nr:hypothetical protein [Spirochaetota bacterium]
MKNMIILIAVFFFLFPFQILRGAFLIDVESGYVLSGYNDAQVPQPEGDRFSLTDDLKTDGSIFGRLELGCNFSERHNIETLIAPLKLKASGRLEKDISFLGTTYKAGSDVDATYRFDSYRLRYRYDLHKTEKTVFGLGLTAKIRDAEISIQDKNSKSTKLNTGFVPLINIHFKKKISDSIAILVSGDALAGGPGRAEDFIIAGLFDLNETWTLKTGYRIVEGGADVSEVYNFTALHYFVAGIQLHL